MKRLWVLSLFFLCGCGAKTSPVYFPGGYKINAELAVTEEQAERGLMDRYKLAPDHGMLFIFDKEDLRTFWMKDTFISLDIIFLNADGQVNCIFDSVKESTPFTEYGDIARVSCPDSKYVLETAAGVAKAQGLKKGAQLKFDYEKV